MYIVDRWSRGRGCYSILALALGMGLYDIKHAQGIYPNRLEAEKSFQILTFIGERA